MSLNKYLIVLIFVCNAFSAFERDASYLQIEEDGVQPRNKDLGALAIIEALEELSPAYSNFQYISEQERFSFVYLNIRKYLKAKIRTLDLDYEESKDIRDLIEIEKIEQQLDKLPRNEAELVALVQDQLRILDQNKILALQKQLEETKSYCPKFCRNLIISEIDKLENKRYPSTLQKLVHYQYPELNQKINLENLSNGCPLAIILGSLVGASVLLACYAF